MSPKATSAQGFAQEGMYELIVQLEFNIGFTPESSPCS